MAERQYHLKFDGAASVDAYLEYRRIVGDDDGGELFSPKEFEDYKKRVLPQRMKNRLFTSWTNSDGMDCKQIGPETLCFCQHRYKQHRTDFDVIPRERPLNLPCQAHGCRCISYHYVPMMGSTVIRCTCKHSADEHAESRPYLCKKTACQSCSGFKSSYSCGCGQTYSQHRMIVETKDERQSRGHPVGMDTPYKAMGGLTGFSSLAEGYMRLDPSGIGPPSDEVLSREITSSDHPFLRAAVPSLRALGKNSKGCEAVDKELAESLSAMRRPGESDMDFFERRYQERLKAEKAEKRRIAVANQRVQPKSSVASRSRNSAGQKDCK